MRKFILQRQPSTDEGTFGFFYSADLMDEVPIWNCLELPWRNNRPSMSCIPPGTYTARWTYSPRFKTHYYRLDDEQTSPRTAILLHPANWAGDRDKGYRSDLDGCIALGKEEMPLLGQMAITRSKESFAEFHTICNGEDIVIEIRGPE